jgi:hypothetical protein
MWIYRTLFLSLAAEVCFSQPGWDIFYPSQYALIEKSLARKFPFIDKDGSGCVSVLEAQEVIFGKWLLGWNSTDISQMCHPTGDKSCRERSNSRGNTSINFTRSALSPWDVLVGASMRASGERMFTDCLMMDASNHETAVLRHLQAITETPKSQP